MERGQESDAQSAGKRLAFSPTPAGEERSLFARVGALERVTRLPRREERAALLGLTLRRARRSSAQHLLGGAACLAMWGILWALIAFAVIFPLGKILSHQPRARSAAPMQTNRSPPFGEQPFGGIQSVSDFARRADSLPLCQPGFIALDGRCVLGEEIEVVPPPGWRRP